MLIVISPALVGVTVECVTRLTRSPETYTLVCRLAACPTAQRLFYGSRISLIENVARMFQERQRGFRSQAPGAFFSANQSDARRLSKRSSVIEHDTPPAATIEKGSRD
jgi:hypothetical protein